MTDELRRLESRRPRSGQLAGVDGAASSSVSDDWTAPRSKRAISSIIWQGVVHPAPAGSRRLSKPIDAAVGETPRGGLILEHRVRKLFEGVRAGHPPGRFTGNLHGRQQEYHEHTDDRDDDEQFNERKARRSTAPEPLSPRTEISLHTPLPPATRKGVASRTTLALTDLQPQLSG